MSKSCFICNESLSEGKTNVVHQKGIKNFIRSSEVRQDRKAEIYLREITEITVHEKCRKAYTNEKNIKAEVKRLENPDNPMAIPRIMPNNVALPGFPFAQKCLFCKENITEEFLAQERRKPDRKRIKVFSIKKWNTIKGIERAASQCDDDWSTEVKQRVAGVDLVSVGAQYHQPCYARFCLPKRPVGSKTGRPEEPRVRDAMDRIFQYLEENRDQCQFSVQELCSVVSDPPTEKTLKAKLLQKYGDDILIASEIGRSSVVCFRPHHLLLDSWYDQKCVSQEEKRRRIVAAAASIIREDIASKIYDTDYYPQVESFLDSATANIPESLQNFLEDIIVKNKRTTSDKLKTKCTFIAHAIIAAARPRSFISSIQIGIAAMIHSIIGSKLVVDILSSLGCCSSYSEVQKFQISAVLHPETKIDNGFVMFVADNADVNIDTLDGLNTFHSMGMIQSVTPKPSTLSKYGIFRITNVPSAAVLGRIGHVPIETYPAELSTNGYKEMTVAPIEKNSRIMMRASDFLWMYGKIREIPLICGWNGFMAQMTHSNKYSISEIIPLPFINAIPSDENTVYTTLLCAYEKTMVTKQKTCIITFDQPLYQKARQMIASSSDNRIKSIVVRLGGFHLLMSFLGSIGYIMKGSGLKELLSLIYAPVSVDKMLSGHAYSRAIRGHLLIHLALGYLILEKIQLTDEEAVEIEEFLETFDDGFFEMKLRDEIFKVILNKLEDELTTAEKNGPTAALWIQYFRMISLVKQFIEAERTGNWELHLSTIQLMMPFFHATAHNNYALSAQIYLQDMRDLESKMPRSEYRYFVKDGFFTIRRSAKFWSGIWSDMTIEQTLMRLMKSKGGLTQGRGFTDSSLTKWVLGMPIMHQVTKAMEEFAGVSSSSTEQHIDARPTRQVKDNSDVEKLVHWLREHDPFAISESIVSLSTGIVGGPEINCYKAYEIGLKLIEDIVGKKFNDISFPRKTKVLPLSAVSSSVKIGDTVVPIDPVLLYQRISFIKENSADMKTYLTYELSPYPLSLFDEVGMRKSKKSAMFDLYSPVIEETTGTTVANNSYVIDGGFLLHKVMWQKGELFSFICDRYVKYVKNTYNGDVVVVFDGYPEEISNRSTKTAERLRRSVKATAPETIFSGSMKATVTKEKFFANEKNKSRLIAILMQKLKTAGCDVKQHQEDADILIVSTALNMSSQYDKVYIVGEDTDLLIILTGTAEPQHNNVFFLKPGKGKSARCLYSSNSLKEQSLAEHILFCHAVTGCDTTSSLFNQGKTKIANILLRNSELRECAATFKNPESEAEDIAKAGENILIALYKGDRVQSLDELRYITYGRSITKSKFNLACLPPTTAAAREHSFRTFHQVQIWMGNSKPAESWGWKQTLNGLMPVPTKKDAAPQELLKMLTCRCTAGCGNKCGCRKGGFKCSEACYSCHGQSCLNARDFDQYENDEDDESTINVDRWLSNNDEYGQPIDSFLDANDADDSPSEDDSTKEERVDQLQNSNGTDQDMTDSVTDDLGPSTSKRSRRL